jgi:predicted RecA/RadA family phage recombinase
MEQLKARTGTMKAGASSALQAGLCLHIDGTNTFDVCEQSDVVIAVTADEQERDSSGLVAGGSIGYYTLGGVLMLASKRATSYAVGGFVYADDNGLVAAAQAGSSKKVGIYVGAGALTTGDTDGDLIAVDTSFAEKV